MLPMVLHLNLSWIRAQTPRPCRYPSPFIYCKFLMSCIRQPRSPSLIKSWLIQKLGYLQQLSHLQNLPYLPKQKLLPSSVSTFYHPLLDEVSSKTFHCSTPRIFKLLGSDSLPYIIYLTLHLSFTPGLIINQSDGGPKNLSNEH